MDKFKLLFLAADPSDAARLRLGQELRDTREKLQLSKYRDNFVLESRESVRPGDITQAIFDVEPQIVHFSGHGMNTGELCFEDILGKAKPVPPSAISNLFELVAGQVSCVLLNACYSETQAKAIAQHIPFVIGMSQAIGDKAAIAFAVGFYKALGAGRSFNEAYKFACIEIQLEGIPEHLTPVLYTKGEDWFDSVASRRQQIQQHSSIQSGEHLLKSPEEYTEHIRASSRGIDGKHCPTCAKDIGIWSIVFAQLPNRIHCPHCKTQLYHEGAWLIFWILCGLGLALSPIIFVFISHLSKILKLPSPIYSFGLFIAFLFAIWLPIELVISWYLRRYKILRRVNLR